MDKIPKPSVLRLDPNDENIILSIPEDSDPHKQVSNVKEKKEPRRSRIVLDKAGVTKADDENVRRTIVRLSSCPFQTCLFDNLPHFIIIPLFFFFFGGEMGITC